MKVSICIPVYNDLDGFTRLINSIKKQTFNDYEVIVSDDSNDDIAEKIKSQTTLSGSSFKYFKHENHTGPADNWNNAINLATGEYIKIMHQDDFFTNEHSLMQYVELLTGCPDADIAFSGSREVYENYTFDRSISAKEQKQLSKKSFYLFFKNCIGAPSAVIFKRGVDACFDSRLKWFVDIDFYIAVLKNNSKYAFTRSPLISIGHGEGQVTNSCVYNSELLKSEGKIIYEKYNLRTNMFCWFYYHLFLKNSFVHFLRKTRRKIKES